MKEIEINLAHLMKEVRRYRLLIGSAACMGLLLSTLIYFNTPEEVFSSFSVDLVNTSPENSNRQAEVRALEELLKQRVSELGQAGYSRQHEIINISINENQLGMLQINIQTKNRPFRAIEDLTPLVKEVNHLIEEQNERVYANDRRKSKLVNDWYLASLDEWYAQSDAVLERSSEKFFKTYWENSGNKVRQIRPDFNKAGESAYSFFFDNAISAMESEGKSVVQQELREQFTRSFILARAAERVVNNNLAYLSSEYSRKMKDYKSALLFLPRVEILHSTRVQVFQKRSRIAIVRAALAAIGVFLLGAVIASLHALFRA